MASVHVDMPKGGGVGVDTVGVVVGSKVVEVDANVVECILLVFSRPLPLPTIFEINMYNN